MMKRLVSISLVVAICVATVTIAYAAPHVPDSEISVEETVYPSGDRVWYVTENEKTITVNLYQDKDYITVDGEKIFFSDVLVNVSHRDFMRFLPQPLAEAKWVYIRTEEYSAEVQKAFYEYSAAVLGGVIGSYFGLPGSVGVSLAATAITRAATKNVIDLERDIFGNQYALNHYKYVDTFTSEGIFVDTVTWYNPAIY